jgi:putative peptidoglycan lipid II flippase
VAAAVGLNFIVDVVHDEQRIAHVGLVASSVILAGVIQVSWALWALHRAGQKWWVRKYTAARQPMRLVLHRLGPMILGLGVLQLNTFFDGVIASYPTTVGNTIFGVPYPLEEGAMAAISYAQRLYQFPLGVFGIAIATAIFPLLARQSDSLEDFAATLRRGLRLVIYIGLPASVGLMLVREPLTAVILQGGDFSASDTERVAFVLLGYAPAVWAYSMIHVLTRAFYARGDSRTPVAIAVGVVALNVLLNCTLIWTPLREAGLAWSTSICSFVQAILLTLVIRRQSIRPIAREVVMSWGKTIAATLVMAAVVWVTAWLFTNQPKSWSEQLVELAVLVTAGGAAYVIASLALRMPEMWWALGSARRPDEPQRCHE